MAGKVIQTLRHSPLATILSEAELHLLASCGHLKSYRQKDIIFEESGLDENLYLLRKGQLSLHLSVWTETGQCGGEAGFKLALPGEAFGWGAWMRHEFLSVSAIALAPLSLVVLDLQRVNDSQSFMKVSQRMLQILYGILQEYGLCPPNIQAWLNMKRLMQAGEIP
jgi:CRP-like cAMP-binding protein